MNPEFDYKERIRRLQSLLAGRKIDAALLSVGADLPYFTGYTAMASERLTMAVVPTGAEPTLFLPLLEAPRVDADIEIVAWEEHQDPIDLVADKCRGASQVAIGDQTWSVFLARLIDHLKDVRWTPLSLISSELRIVKDEHELAALRRAAEAVDRVLARIPDEVGFQGRPEIEVSRQLARMTMEEGHQASEFSIVASGPNGASPHHEPGNREISRGDLVVCDFGGPFDGYYSDVTRTFSVGEPNAQQVEVHQVVRSANMAGRSAVAPGVSCESVDRAARAVIADAGYGDEFIHRTGHGIGLEVHEHPYLVEGNSRALEPGMAFSVEPGIYLDGELGVRIEDIVTCGSHGVVELNKALRDLVVVA